MSRTAPANGLSASPEALPAAASRLLSRPSRMRADADAISMPEATKRRQAAVTRRGAGCG
jgi:hypothetical protein